LERILEIRNREKESYIAGHVHHEIDTMIGQKFSKWLVLDRAIGKSRLRMYHCHCDCGVKSVVSGSRLRRGKSRGCGDCRAKTHAMNHVGWNLRSRTLTNRKAFDDVV
jgi:hypothetical protein